MIFVLFLFFFKVSLIVISRVNKSIFAHLRNGRSAIKLRSLLELSVLVLQCLHGLFRLRITD